MKESCVWTNQWGMDNLPAHAEHGARDRSFRLIGTTVTPVSVTTCSSHNFTLILSPKMESVRELYSIHNTSMYILSLGFYNYPRKQINKETESPKLVYLYGLQVLSYSCPHPRHHVFIFGLRRVEKPAGART